MSVRRLSVVWFIVFMALALSQPTPAASPPQPTYGTASVDGSIGEWNLANDFFANMYRAGDSSKPLESRAYLRYDCSTHTMYVLVLAVDGVPALAEGWESSAWAAIDTISNKVYSGNSGDDGSPPDFQWVGLSGDGETALGYEASFTLDPGSYTLMVHIEVFDSGTAQTSATDGFPQDGVPLEIVCGPNSDPSIILEKYVSVDGGLTYQAADSSPGPTAVAGDPVYFKFVVTNNGNVPLTNITLTDDIYNLGGCTVPASLAPGGSFECATGAFTAVHGQQRDTGAATGDFGGNTYTHTDDAYYLGVTPRLDVTKYVSVDDCVTWEDANSPTGPHALVGEEVCFKFVVTNSGDVPLDNITLTDNVYDLSGCTIPSSLAAGASFECMLDPLPAQPGQHTNTAAVTGDHGGQTYSETNAANYFGEHPCIDIVKSFIWTTGDGTMVGDVVTFTFTVTNEGNVPLDNVMVTDNQFGPITLLVTSLAPGASTTGTAALTVTQALLDAGSHSNIAMATGTPPIGPDVTDTTAQTVYFTQFPSLDIIKTFMWTAGDGSQVGDIVTFTFTVTNNGNVTLNPVTVADSHFGVITLSDIALAPGETATGTAALILTQALLDAGSHSNTATATGTPPVGLPATDTASQTVTFSTSPSIDVLKTFAWTTGDGSQVGDVVTFTFKVTNNGNVTLSNVTATDDRLGFLTTVATMAPGASVTVTRTLAVTQALLNAGTHTNIVTATGTPPIGPDVTDSDTQTVIMGVQASIDIIKTFSWTEGDGSQVGDKVTFTFTVTNNGNVTLNSFGVTDDKLGDIPMPDMVLAPGQSVTSAATLTLTQELLDAGSHTNIATAVGTPPVGEDVTDTASQTVDFITVVSIDILKTFVWTEGNGSQVGDKVTFTFTVTNNGNVTLNSFGVTDDKLGDIPMPDMVLAPGQSVTSAATLTLTQELLDAGSQTNIATVTGTPPSGPDVTDTATQKVCFMQMPEIDLVKCVSVDDGATWDDANNPTGPFVPAGDPVKWRYVITNTGNVTLSGLTLGDSDVGAITLGATTLAPGGSTTAYANGTAVDWQYTNLATAAGTSPLDVDVHDTDTANYFGVVPEIDVVKEVATSAVGPWDDANSPTGPVIRGGSDVYFRYTITNIGNVLLTNLTLTDSVFDGDSVPPFAPDPIPDPLAPGATYTYTYGPVEAICGQHTDTARATGMPPVGSNVAHEDDANYLGICPLIDVEKLVSTSGTGPWIDADSAPGLDVLVGTSLYFQFIITNTGDVALTGVTLTDSVFNAGSAPPFMPGTVPDPFEPGATYTYVYGPILAELGQHTDTATATGTPPVGPEVTDEDDAYYTGRVIGEPGGLLQAYPGDSNGRNTAFAGYLASPGEVIRAVPGVFLIIPQDDGEPAWANFVRAFRDGLEYTLKGVRLCKQTPSIIQCADRFPAQSICQQGTPNIRLRWPLMYEIPGTTWTLSILYGTTTPYDSDGPGPELLGYAHTEVWTWQVDATLDSLKNLLTLFHEVPFGLDEVPLISDEQLYPILLAKVEAIADIWEDDPVTAGMILGDFEMEVMDACIAESPSRPKPTGNGTGIANSEENPACCKLLADAEYIGFKLNILQPVKAR